MFVKDNKVVNIDIVAGDTIIVNHIGYVDGTLSVEWDNEHQKFILP